MKTLLFQICFLAFFSLARAQSHFRFSRLLFPDSTVAYAGYDNSIELVNVDYNAHLEIKALYGTVFSLENSRHFWYQTSRNPIDTLIFYEDGKEIEKIAVRRATVPEPQILLAGSASGKINRKLLLAAPYFVIRYKGLLLGSYDYVSSINAILICGKETVYGTVSGNFIPREIVEIIARYPNRMILDCQIKYLGGISGCGRSTNLRYEIF